MSKQIHKSTAFLAYVDGENIQDVQILIDDLQVFNALPGKHERNGIKTLASWPIFVTAILNERQPEAESVVLHHSGGLS